MQMELQTIPSIQERIIALPGRPPAMLDRDLAEIYGAQTRVLNRQVKANEDWFTEKYRFNLTHDEAVQFLHRQPNQYTPWAYTHEGCNLAAFVLNTPEAKSQREIIIEAFSALERGDVGLSLELSNDDMTQIAQDAACWRTLTLSNRLRKMDHGKIQKWRHYMELPLNQKERAKLLDVDPSTLRKYENLLIKTFNPIVALVKFPQKREQ